MAETYDSTRITVVDHPLVQHKLSIMRRKETDTKAFREFVKELAILEAYEATRDFPLESIEIQTPICKTTAMRIAGKHVAIIPILRAGLGMVDGLMTLIPSAKVGHLGMYRDEVTHKPHAYYDKMPPDIQKRTCLVVDPMLATGGSAASAVEYLRKKGVQDLRVLVLVATPEGLNAVLSADKDVRIFTCAIDEGLNDDAYIVPGLGDAGDRIFGTV